jgi:hypothetical protein
MEMRNLKYRHLSSTTAGDAMAAYLTFMSARSFFFWVLLVGLLVIQSAFWTVNQGFVDTMLPGLEKNVSTVFVSGESSISRAPARLMFATVDEEPSIESKSPPSLDTPDPDRKSEPIPQWNKEQLAHSFNRLIKIALPVCYYVMSFSAILYCLTLLGGVNLAIVGRFNGLADSSKAFFLSLVLMVLIVPWTRVFDPAIFVTLYSYRQLAENYLTLHQHQPDLSAYVAYYARFVGLWAVSFIVLLTTYFCSRRSAKTALVEIEVPPPAPVSTTEDRPF